jgi:hypothetical protein
MSRCGAATQGAPPHALHCRSLRANEGSAGASPGSRPPDWRAAVAETPRSGSGAECRGTERRWKGDVRRSARRQFAHAEGWKDWSFRLDNRCRHDRRHGERDSRRHATHARAGAVVVRVVVVSAVMSRRVGVAGGVRAGPVAVRPGLMHARDHVHAVQGAQLQRDAGHRQGEP